VKPELILLPMNLLSQEVGSNIQDSGTPSGISCPDSTKLDFVKKNQNQDMLPKVRSCNAALTNVQCSG
jgi:hypothetical protein